MDWTTNSLTHARLRDKWRWIWKKAAKKEGFWLLWMQISSSSQVAISCSLWGSPLPSKFNVPQPLNCSKSSFRNVFSLFVSIHTTSSKQCRVTRFSIRKNILLPRYCCRCAFRQIAVLSVANFFPISCFLPLLSETVSSLCLGGKKWWNTTCGREGCTSSAGVEHISGRGWLWQDF